MKWLFTIYIGLFVAGFTAPAQTYEERAVAAVLMGEAWSEGATGMTAVANVIHQRVIEKGRTPLEVVAAHGERIHAFSCVDGTSLDQLIQKFSRERDYGHALQIAQTLCRTPDSLPDLVASADHYTLADEHPYWARGRQPVARIGRLAFYRLRDR
jgi:spore germination cell wall hydrolase CwlJ-like protein